METDKDIDNWQEVVSYLGAIRDSGAPVVFYAGDRGTERHHALQTPGYLGEPVITAERGEEETIIPVHWPDPDDEGVQVIGAGPPLQSWSAYVTLPHSRFEGGHLSTLDGCDYFGLRLDFDSFSIKIGDTNAY